MRLIIAVVMLAITFAITPAEAQPLLLGGRIGSASATQHLSMPQTDYDRRRGLSGGLAATVEFESWLAVQMEALYAEKGARLDRSYEMRIDYLEAPLLARVAWPAALRGVRPFLLGGVAPSVELRCSGYTSGSFRAFAASPPPGSTPLECNGQRLRYSDRGKVFGGGFLFNRSRQQLTLEIRRTRGQDISGYGCCELRNDVTSILIGASRRMQ